MFATQTVPETMRGMVYDSSGPGRMAWTNQMKVPIPGKNQVLVKVESASMNPADYQITQAHVPFFSHKGHIVGQDMAGTIVGIGKNVRTFAVGDKVFGLAPGYASYTVADVHRITRIPPGMELSEFGVYGLVGTVAHQLLCKHWFDKANYTVRSLLVVGASGGVGSAVIQIARALGGPEVMIYGVSSHKNLEYVKQIGANQAIDYTTPNFNLSSVLPAHSVDLIVDVVSGRAEIPDYVDQGMPLLRQSGRYVALNSTRTMDWVRSKMTNSCGCNVQRARYDLFTVNRTLPHRDLEAVARHVALGKLRLHVSQELPLSETPLRRALHNMKQRHVRGKLKIRPEHFGQPTSYA